MFNRFRKRRPKIVPEPMTREALEALHGQVWDVQQLAAEFIIIAIIDNEVVVRRKADDEVGVLKYQSNPTLYYGFKRQPSAE